METTHTLRVGDSRELAAVADDAVDLVVTSPPYPMIDLWDELFVALDPEIGRAFDRGDGRVAFDRMHRILGDVWDEMKRVLVPGGIACINIGDATRRLDDHFEKYGNAARITRELTERGFTGLPDVLWHKPTNAATKFMGSGMLPPNAYVTLEHEYVLIFRNGRRRRSFVPGADRRYEAAYFWEERNTWFSDVWTDVRGTTQALDGNPDRSRSGAFPFAIPYRLINMYSVYGDTILDPFCGTGTTTRAAMVSARHSIGVDTNEAVIDTFDPRDPPVERLAEKTLSDRLAAHQRFVEEHRREGGNFGYRMTHYDLPVKTTQERRIKFYGIEELLNRQEGYRIRHQPFATDLADRDGSFKSESLERR